MASDLQSVPSSQPELSSHQEFPAAPPPQVAPNPWPENEDEWEYEYSNTETETFYLTLDFSIPELTRTRPPVRYSRGTRVRWINPSTARQKKTKMKLATTLGPQAASEEPEEAGSSGNENHDEDEEAAEQDNDEDLEMDDTNMFESRAAKELEDQIDNIAETVQIMDLESENPWVAYKGHTFSCTWAENLGTELLLTNHDKSRPLPVLRSLKDGIDLLAASSARLVSREIKLEPKQQVDGAGSVARQGAANGSNTGKFASMELPFRVDPGNDANAEKMAQASFLERLIAIKKSKGEEDEVTIVTHKRPRQAGWRALIRAKKQDELKELSRLIKTGRATEDEQQKAAELEKNLAAWQDADSDKKKVEGKQRKRRFFDRGESDGKRSRARSGRGPRAGSSSLAISRAGSASIGKPGHTAILDQQQGALSTPTPQSWSELEAGEEAEGNMDE